jgi:hypothetical protein
MALFAERKGVWVDDSLILGILPPWKHIYYSHIALEQKKGALGQDATKVRLNEGGNGEFSVGYDMNRELPG